MTEQRRGPRAVEVVFAFGFSLSSIVNGLLLRGPNSTTLTFGGLAIALLSGRYAGDIARYLLEALARDDRGEH